jgi:hypothetical protein
MSDIIPTKGYIYLLKMCDTSHRTIYKPGKSVNFYKRYKEYNYAKILTFIISDDITKDENEIIKIFNINCKLDTGREFFLAKDDMFVLKLFMDYFINKIDRSIEESNTVESESIIDNVHEVVDMNSTGDEESDEETIVSNSITISNIVSESSDTIETIENRKLLERTCPNCKKVFSFSSRLKAHLETTIHCKKTDTEIKIFFNKFEKKSNFKCNICSSKYTKMQNLKRHIENSKCKKIIIHNNLLNEIENIKLQITKLN